jgi:predicted DNA-binding protein
MGDNAAPLSPNCPTAKNIFTFLSKSAFLSPYIVGGILRMRKRAVRVSPELDQRIQQSAKDRGYRTPSAFIRAAIEDQLKSHTAMVGMEEQTAASFDRLLKELRRVLRGQQALFALVDALTKAFLTCIPEPPMEARAHSIALARDRYTRLMKNAGSGMAGESRSAMQGLLGKDDE